MKILAVHSSSLSLGVAASRDDQVLGYTILPPSRGHAEKLALTIQDLLARLNLEFADLDLCAAAVGPGSFSGTRVGIATVKGLALALGKPVLGVSSLEILAWQCLRPGETGAAVIDAGRKQAYVGLYLREATALRLSRAPALVSRERFAEILDPGINLRVLCGDPLVEELASHLDHPVRTEIVVPSPATCARAAYHRFMKQGPDELHTLAPLYIRRSDAEENRERMRRGLHTN